MIHVSGLHGDGQQWIGRSASYLQVNVFGLLTSMQGSTFCVCELLLKELVQWRQDRWLLPLQMKAHLQAAFHRQTYAGSIHTLCNFQYMYIQSGSRYIQGIM